MSPKQITMADEAQRQQKAKDSIQYLLQYFGEDPNREGLVETPKRYIKFMREFFNPPEFEMKTFDNDKRYDEMVCVDNIPFFSLCEHHLAPFFGTAAIAYIPDKRIVGLSKLPRTLEKFCRKLQCQERITQQVCDYIMSELKPLGVGVKLKARHLCIEMRGVQKHDVLTTTCSLASNFKESHVKEEFFKNLKNG